MSFNGTMFNDDQLDHMRAIGRLPPEQVSWCGWGRAGDRWCCANPECEGKTQGKTLADKMKVWCPACRNYPRNGIITHTKRCTATPTGSTEP